MKPALSLALIFYNAAVFADEASATINVQPRLCIVDERTPYCDVTFDIKWRSANPGEFCVKADEDSEPLHCWVEKDQGQVDDERKVSETFHYELTEEEQTKAAAKVEVLRMDSDDRRRRRRTRHVWDVL